MKIKPFAHFVLKGFNIFVLTVMLFNFSYMDNANAYSDQYTPDEIFTEYSNQQKKLGILYYFNGLGAGINWTKSFFDKQGMAPLFCEPRKESFGPEDFFRIWRTEYFRKQEIYDSLDSQPAGLILLFGLINEYPCS